MAVNNGIIAAPISASDPYYAMGIGQYNGTYDVGWACSNSHGNTNKFAKYKPIRYNSLFEVDEFQKDQANYGVWMPDFDFYHYNTNVWEYRAPRGESHNEPYRLLDFENYSHNAVSPIEIEWLELAVYGRITLLLSFKENEPSFDKTKNITYRDIARNEEFKLAVCLFDSYYHVRSFWMDSLRFIDRLGYGKPSYQPDITTKAFNPGERVIARVMLVSQPSGTNTPSYGFSLAYKDVSKTADYGIDTLEFYMPDGKVIIPPMSVNRNIEIEGTTLSDRLDLFILNKVTLVFSNRYSPADAQTEIEVICYSTNGQNNNNRSILKFTWNVGDSKDFTKVIEGINLGDREYFRRADPMYPSGYAPMKLNCIVTSTTIGLSNTTEIGRRNIDI